MDSTFFEPCPSHFIRKAGKCWRQTCELTIFDPANPDFSWMISISKFSSLFFNIRPVRIREFFLGHWRVTKHTKRSEVIRDGEHPVEHGFRRDEFHPGRCGLGIQIQWSRRPGDVEMSRKTMFFLDLNVLENILRFRLVDFFRNWISSELGSTWQLAAKSNGKDLTFLDQCQLPLQLPGAQGAQDGPRDQHSWPEWSNQQLGVHGIPTHDMSSHYIIIIIILFFSYHIILYQNTFQCTHGQLLIHRYDKKQQNGHRKK